MPKKVIVIHDVIIDEDFACITMVCLDDSVKSLLAQISSSES